MLLRVDSGLDGLHVVGVHVDEHVVSVHVDVVASEDVQLAVGAGLCGRWSQWERGGPLGCRWAAAGLPLGCCWAAAGLLLGCWSRLIAGLLLGCRWLPISGFR
jgi:hypothetical protein